jgi:D-3-phosphoglycerate dehydrogenase / 2-oxoglutarate reductase
VKPNAVRVVYFEPWQDPVSEQILRRRPEIEIGRLSPTFSESDNLALLRRAHAYQIGAARDELPRYMWAEDGLLGQCPDLLVVSSHGAGFDTIDLAACTRAGVLAVNQAGGNKEGVAEHALAMMLTLSKKLINADRRMRRAHDFRRADFIGNDLLGKTLGVVGIGHIGTRLAELCRGLFGMRVLAFDPYLDAGEIARRGAEKTTLEVLLRESDFVSVHCPRTAETENMIGRPQFAAMKPTAYFINTARGGIHDEAALQEALERRALAGAGLDVWAVEPPPLDHPLLGRDDVIASPHIAGITRESRRRIATIAAEQLLEALDGRRPPRLLNPEVWPAYARRFERIMGKAAED